MSSNIDSILEQQASSFSEGKSAAGFLQVVYAWMMGGLLLTAVTAFAVLSSESVLDTVLSVRTIILFAQLGLVLWLSARIESMSVTTARILYLTYSVMVGLTMSAVLVYYAPDSVLATFLSCSLMFGATSAFGYLTKRDLSSIGSFFFMGLIGIVIASLVNMFLQSSALNFAISIIGILVFVVLTAWDTQKLKAIALSVEGSDATARIAIMGALNLYLDFINMFLFLLRFLGRRR